jgi:cell division protein FtsN
MKAMKQQRGGTILGLMIGVVLGLAAALAVAVFVTKTPSPFNNKGQVHNSESDATESKKNKDWDPNSALQGKNPAKPTPTVVPGLAPTAPTAPATTAATSAATPKATANTLPAMPLEKPVKAANPSNPAAPSAATPSNTSTPVVPGSLGPSVAAGTTKPAPGTTPKSPSTDPLGDMLKQKNDPRSSNSASEPFMYFVQAGAYRTPEDAEAQRARLSLIGVEAKVTEREQSGRTVYRVRSGPFNKEEDADRMKDKISATGADAALVRVQR